MGGPSSPRRLRWPNLSLLSVNKKSLILTPAAISCESAACMSVMLSRYLNVYRQRNLLKTAAVLLWSCIIVPPHVALAQAPSQDLSSLLSSVDLSPKTIVSFPGQTAFTNATQREGIEWFPIDLNHFDKLEIDATLGTMTIGPAIRTADLLNHVFDAGYEIQNSELFWGIRGAAANLGLITEVTYELHKFANGTKGSGQGLNADFIFSAEKTAS
ncbi:hypothetical protein VM1G_00784 [Cytospora mali]|uniref:Uncharacterized protein n=1 Tax=Cytospora mali TaxID=578113 RepID=A0A194VN80_CYTMA|nr:hypothetical protein VM1G_00784 [Valsa mali]